MSVQRRLTRAVTLDLVVTDTNLVVTRIRGITTASGGYVSGIDARRHNGTLTFSMQLRVPASGLDETVAGITALADSVEREHRSVEDVTDRIIDLDARLRTVRAAEAELLGLFEGSRDEEQGLDDLMAVYRELTAIRGEVEQYEAQLQGLEKRVDMATINLELLQVAPLPARPTWSAGEQAHASARWLVVLLQALAGFAIFFGIVIAPLTVVIGVPIWATARLWKRVSAQGNPT